jgi:hypothetical protein
MSRLPGFVDQSNIARSVDIDVERTVNLVWEASAANPKVPASLYSRPGIAPWVDLGMGPVRELYTQDDRVFGVGGTRFVELFAGQTAVIRGTVVADGNPATICSNGGSDGSGGHQLFIVSGGHGYIFDLVANTLTEITAEGFPRPALMGFFLDGYFGVLKTASNQFNLSHLEDGLTWDALDVAELSQQPGWVLSVIVSHNQLWPFTVSRVNPWYDSGATFPLQPVLGADMQVGILAPWSAAVMDNTLYWLGQTLAGGAQVFLADGYSAKRISTHALETRLQGLPQVSDAVAWTCQLDGHSFYVLYLAHNDTHWVYDAASQRWTEWAHWDSDAEVWTPFRGRCHTFGFGTHLVGDFATGMIYALSNALYTDRRVA